MKWPWVSRGAYEAVEAERDRWMAQHQTLLDTMVRVVRADAGLSEAPRVPRDPPDPMPEELQDYIRGFKSPAGRREMRREALKRRFRDGESWADITASIMADEE